MQEYKWVLDIANRQLSKMLVLTRDGLAAHSRVTARFRHVSYFNNNIATKVQFLGLDCKCTGQWMKF